METTPSTLEEILKNSGVSTIENTSVDILQKYGLNWKVEKLPLSLPDGKDSGFFGITRSDNSHVFATAKEGYECYQNSELLELVNEAAGNLGLSVTNGGGMKEGALIYFQIKNGKIDGIGNNNDTVQGNVTALNSHDGSKSLRFGVSNITISCLNTFNYAYSELKNTVKHTESMRFRIETIMNQIKNVQKIEQGLFETFFKLAEIKVTKTDVAKVVNTVLAIDLLGGTKSDLTTYQQNRLSELSSAINREMKQKGETLWGLFNGVTRYTTHSMPGGNDSRLQGKFIGSGFKHDNAVFSQLAEVVK